MLKWMQIKRLFAPSLVFISFGLSFIPLPAFGYYPGVPNGFSSFAGTGFFPGAGPSYGGYGLGQSPRLRESMALQQAMWVNANFHTPGTQVMFLGGTMPASIPPIGGNAVQNVINYDAVMGR